MPLLNPVMVRLVAEVAVSATATDQAPPTGRASIRYPMIGAPPLDNGAVHERFTDSLPRVPDTPVGAPGTVRGVTAADAMDAAEAPSGFVALTVNVYPVPLVNPDTVHEVVGAVAVHVLPPGGWSRCTR